MKMINKRWYLYSALLLVIILSPVIYARRGHFYKISLFKSEDRWGYDIQVKGKAYIHQPYMPAVEGEVPFPDKKSAKKTARLVIRKIRNHKSPSVTKEELQSILGN